jgi:hypothetical protein
LVVIMNMTGFVALSPGTGETAGIAGELTWTINGVPAKIPVPGVRSVV